MTSVISLDERLAACLPPKAKVKLRRIVAQAMDSEAAVRSLIAARERLGEELAGIRHQSRQARERAEALNLDAEKEVAEFAPLVAELEREIGHVDAQRAAREARRNDDAQLVAQVRDWLAHLPAGMALAQAPARAAKPNDDETAAQAVARVRNEIGKRQAELRLLHAAPLPTAELEEKARAFVAELAAAGTPSLYVDQGRFEPRWMPGAWATTGTMAPAGAALIAWLFPDAMVAAMETLIDGIGSSGMSASERPRREAALLRWIGNLERDEEALIERASEDGVEIGRRPTASPLAVLGVVESVAQRAAS